MRRLLVAVALFVAAALLVGGAGVGFGRLADGGPAPLTGPRPVGTLPATAGGSALAADMAAQQQKVALSETDYTAWAQLGLDYVQQAKITVDPSYYPKAEGVLQRSLALRSDVNFLGMAGMAALKAAQHDFAAARAWARKGLAINPYNATLYGALDDADTQLGRYDEAQAAAQKMNDLRPGVPAYTRGEYVFELHGDLPNARASLQRALQEASTPADRAFVHHYLGQLAFDNGDPATALAENTAARAADPVDSASLAGLAQAEAALGQTDDAVRDYLAVVGAVPQPQYVVEAGELLQSLGRTAEAQQQYAVFDAEAQLFAANGVTLDTDPTLFYADHDQPAKALQYGEVGIRVRPFLEMDDAYAWALHVNGRDADAAAWSQKAMRLGTRNALFAFHAGMIDKALGQSAQAVAQLRRALAINPHFSPLLVPQARAALAELGVSA